MSEARDSGWTLRLGRWQDVLEDVAKCDAVITDPPYGARTHSGHDEGMGAANRVSEADAKRQRVDKRTGAVYAVGANRRRSIDYAHWTAEDVDEFADAWCPRTKGWVCAMTSHDLIPAYEVAYERHDRYGFAPLPCIVPIWCVIPGMSVRMGGDGPSSWSVVLMPARPKTREFQRWGTLDGGYWTRRGEHAADAVVAGAKPLWLMRAIIRDYTRPGDLVVDPCAGGGTTLLAAVIEGRRAIGAECDPGTYAKAVKRLRRGYTPVMDFGGGDAA